MKLHQIAEDDLAELERIMPQLQYDLNEAMTTPAAPRIRKQLRQVKDILSNVRWGYGPFTEVEIIPADQDPQSPEVR